MPKPMEQMLRCVGHGEVGFMVDGDDALRYAQEAVVEAEAPLKARIAELEARVFELETANLDLSAQVSRWIPFTDTSMKMTQFARTASDNGGKWQTHWLHAPVPPLPEPPKETP